MGKKRSVAPVEQGFFLGLTEGFFVVEKIKIIWDGILIRTITSMDLVVLCLYQTVVLFALRLSQ